MINPLVVVAGFLFLAFLCGCAISALSRRAWRAAHPTVATRRQALDRAVMMDEITDDQYAEKRIALDHEAEAIRLRRRMR